MNVFKELKIEANKSIKFLIRISKRLKRRSVILFSLCTALVSGFVYFNLSNRFFILLILMTSTIIFCYNLFEAIINICINTQNKIKKWNYKRKSAKQITTVKVTSGRV